jgi:hypothetical protein
VAQRSAVQRGAVRQGATRRNGYHSPGGAAWRSATEDKAAHRNRVRRDATHPIAT